MFSVLIPTDRPCGKPLIVESDRDDAERLFADQQVGSICKNKSSFYHRLLGPSVAYTSRLPFIMFIALLVFTVIPSLALAEKEQPRGGEFFRQALAHRVIH